MKKIAIIGPESTGKSTLTKDLANYFGEPFVPEYGRKYLETNGNQYDESDLLKISEGMLEAENKAAKKANRFLFCDTDLIMIKVWYEVKYGECHPYVLAKLAEQPYDFYLLCSPDLPWVPDSLRENPGIRKELFKLYKANLELYKLPYQLIGGEERLAQAKIGIDEFKNQTTN